MSSQSSQIFLKSPKFNIDVISSLSLVVCAFECTSCQTTVTTCLTCKGNRLTPPSCACPDGSYDDGQSVTCPLCDASCVLCNNSTGCTQCRGNRVRTVVGDMACDCPPAQDSQPSIDHLPSSYYCTSCDTAYIEINFSNDFMQIKIKFFADIGLPSLSSPTTFKVENCAALFASASIALIGSDSKCRYRRIIK